MKSRARTFPTASTYNIIWATTISPATQRPNEDVLQMSPSLWNRLEPIISFRDKHKTDLHSTPPVTSSLFTLPFSRDERPSLATGQLATNFVHAQQRVQATSALCIAARAEALALSNEFFDAARTVKIVRGHVQQIKRSILHLSPQQQETEMTELEIYLLAAEKAFENAGFVSRIASANVKTLQTELRIARTAEYEMNILYAELVTRKIKDKWKEHKTQTPYLQPADKHTPAIATWRDNVAKILTTEQSLSRVTATTFPAPPVLSCWTLEACRGSGKARDGVACDCSIEAAFRGVTDLDPRRERLRWHPSRFASCETTPEAVHRKAETVFAILDQAYVESCGREESARVDSMHSAPEMPN